MMSTIRRMHWAALIVAVGLGSLLLAGCERCEPLAPGAGDGGTPLVKQGGNTTGSNNLSVPVFFAEGIGLSGLSVTEATGMPGDLGDVWGTATPYEGTLYFLQQSDNIWQADWVNGLGGAPVEVIGDWADAMTHQIWDEHSIIRTEVVLFKSDFEAYQASLATPLKGFVMAYLYGEGIDEVHGTPADPATGYATGTVMDAVAATVYSSCARYTIQKLAWPADINNVPTGLIPDSFEAGYDAYVAATFYNSAVYDRYGVDGPTGAYSAELNVPGKVIYGYNFDLLHFRPPTAPKKDTPGFDWPVDLLSKTGWWRITFSFDAGWAGATRNAAVIGPDASDLEEQAVFQPVVVIDPVDPTGNYAYLDLFVTD